MRAAHAIVLRVLPISPPTNTVLNFEQQKQQFAITHSEVVDLKLDTHIDGPIVLTDANFGAAGRERRSR